MVPRHKSKVEPFGRGAIILTVVVVFLIASAFYVGFSSTPEPTMPIVHILLLKFKESTKPETIQRVSPVLSRECQCHTS